MNLRRIGKVALAVFLIKGYALLVLYLLSTQTLLKNDYTAFLFLSGKETRDDRLSTVRGSFVNRLTPYDGQFYLDIAANGYRRFEFSRKTSRQIPTTEGNYAFFPLLPALLRASQADHSTAGVAFVLFLNMLLATGACVGVWILARNLQIPAWLALGFLLCYPGAVFQSVLYGEAPFLFLSVAVAVGAYHRRHRIAAFFGYLGGLCRPQGILLAALNFGDGPRRTRWLRLAAALGPVAGILTFAVLLSYVIGSPLGFIEIQRDWGREFSMARPVQELFGVAERGVPPLDRLGFLFGLGLLPFLWRYLPRSLALYGTASVVLPLLSGSILSFGRFMSVSFPHFLCLAKMFENWRVASVVLLVGLAVFQTFLAKGLIGWHFVG